MKIMKGMKVLARHRRYNEHESGVRMTCGPEIKVIRTAVRARYRGPRPRRAHSARRRCLAYHLPTSISPLHVLHVLQVLHGLIWSDCRTMRRMKRLTSVLMFLVVVLFVRMGAQTRP